MAVGDRRSATHPSKKGASRETSFMQAVPTVKSGMEPDTMARHQIKKTTKSDGENQLGNLPTPY